MLVPRRLLKCQVMMLINSGYSGLGAAPAPAGGRGARGFVWR